MEEMTLLLLLHICWYYQYLLLYECVGTINTLLFQLFLLLVLYLLLYECEEKSLTLEKSKDLKYYDDLNCSLYLV